MIDVNILDSSTATVDGVTITGPARFLADEVTIGATDFRNGALVLQAGTPVHTMKLEPAHEAAIPYSLFAFFLVGLSMGFAKGRFLVLAGLFLLASPASADYFRHYEVLTNPGVEEQTYRVSVFNAEITGGDSFKYAPEHTTGNPWLPGGGWGYSGAGTVRIAYRWKTAGNVIVGAIQDLGTVSVTLNASGYATNQPVYPEATCPEPTATKFDRLAKRESPYFESGWRTYTQETALSTGTTEEAYTRGTLINSWELVLAPNASTTIDVQHATEIVVVIEKLVQIATPDGGYNYTYEQIGDDIPGTEVITADEPATEIVAGPPDYSPGPDPDPTPRPNTVADTTDKLDENQEARHEDELAILKQIRDAAVQQVNQAAAAATKANEGDGKGLGENAAEDAETVDTALETESERVGELTDAIGTLQGTLQGIAGMYSVAISGSEYPAFGIQLPSVLGGSYVDFNLASYSTLWALLRFILLCCAGYYAINHAIDIIRGALA